MEIASNTTVSLSSILSEIGFQHDGATFKFDFGNGKLSAVHGMNHFFQEGYSFYGNYISERTAGEIDFFLPLQVNTYEEGLALIAYYLRSADIKNKPNWLIEGLALKEYLPWEKEMKKYNENPKATIEHEWFRVLVNKLRLLVSKSSNEDVTTFSFDGTVLKVVCNNETFIISASGKNWQRTATVKTKSLDFLPKRIQNRNISIYIWKDKLFIGNRVFIPENL